MTRYRRLKRTFTLITHPAPSSADLARRLHSATSGTGIRRYGAGAIRERLRRSEMTTTRHDKKKPHMPSDVTPDLSPFDRFASAAARFASRAWFFSLCVL